MNEKCMKMTEEYDHAILYIYMGRVIHERLTHIGVNVHVKNMKRMEIYIKRTMAYI